MNLNLLVLLTDEERRDLETVGVPRRGTRGQAILVQGQVGDRVVVIREGRVKLSTCNEDGIDLVLGFAGPGSLLGEHAVFEGLPRASSAIAIEDVSMLAVSANDFRAYLSAHTRVSEVLLGRLSARVRDANERLLEWAALDTLGRVAARLVELVEEHGEPEEGGVHITLPITQEDLAAWTGSSREATVKALRTLREVGWISTARRSIVVHDVAAVRARA